MFHFSGHGSQQRNYTGDEVDGFDETLCPLDFETQGMIVDDEINATIVRPLPHGVKLHAIIDACHSGTVLDLPFLCRMNRSVIPINSSLSTRDKCGVHKDMKIHNFCLYIPTFFNGFRFQFSIVHLFSRGCLWMFPLDHRSGQYAWEDHRPRSGVWKGTSGGEVISFSGCDDDQTSADTSVMFISHSITHLLIELDY